MTMYLGALKSCGGKGHFFAVRFSFTVADMISNF